VLNGGGNKMEENKYQKFFCPICKKECKIIEYDNDEIISDRVDESFLIYCDNDKTPIRIVIGNGVEDWYKEVK
jgi:C4-type Zn-finger protein